MSPIPPILNPQGIRFAPSPTGDFHVGNLRTAWISHRIARHLGEPWVVRFEDIDRPRVIAGAREKQLEDMRTFGMVPDQLIQQSDRHARHFEVFERARAAGMIYPCFCSRKDVVQALEGAGSAPHAPAIEYSGRCRDLRALPDSIPANLGWRFRREEPAGSRDFLVARTTPISRLDPRVEPSDFFPSYHWACAIDDHDGRYRLLVRAWDLELATPVQRSIQSWLGETGFLFHPAVFHTSLVVQDDGHRLEKRTAGVTTAELSARGLSIRRLLELFERSFDPNLLDSSTISGAITGESSRSIRLGRLLGDASPV